MRAKATTRNIINELRVDIDNVFTLNITAEELAHHVYYIEDRYTQAINNGSYHEANELDEALALLQKAEILIAETPGTEPCEMCGTKENVDEILLMETGAGSVHLCPECLDKFNEQ